MSKSKKFWESIDELIPNESRTILNDYLLKLKLENKSEATITKYRWLLERFLRDCKVPIGVLTSKEVLNWINKFCREKKTKTVVLYLSILSSFFIFCLNEDYTDTLLIKKRWRPSNHDPLPQFLSEQEYALVKVVMEKMPLRNRALVLFLFSSGCRVSEVSNLKIQDLNMNKRTAQVTGKRKKTRTVHFSEECYLVLQDYLETRSYNPNEPVFLNKFGKNLQRNGIYLITTKLGRLVGLEQSLHPHVCRHTFATHMLARGAELEFIADELGHDNLNTTRIYAQIPTVEMMDSYHSIMG